MANALVSIQIIPSVPQGEDVYEYVDQAIQVIEESGVKYEVHPLETTMEGELETLLKVVQTMNDQLVKAGANSIISQVKILYNPDGVSADSLTEKYK